MQSIRYFSLFSGIGGFELGIEQAFADYRTDRLKQPMQTALSGPGDQPVPDGDAGTATCVGYSEIEPGALSVYQSHFPSHPAFGDITKIDADALPEFDLLCGGFPCQSFSTAGSMGGLEDPRGALFFDIARIIEAKSPSYLLLENVKGFLTHEGGATALRCFSILDELGYDCEWQVLNGKNFNVPQNRERVFIVGHLRGSGGSQVFPFFHSTRRTSVSGKAIELARSGTSGIRRLTPLECERVQGFPDNWTSAICDTRRYQCLGNAVIPNVVRDICLRLLAERSEH